MPQSRPADQCCRALEPCPNQELAEVHRDAVAHDLVGLVPAAQLGNPVLRLRLHLCRLRRDRSWPLRPDTGTSSPPAAWRWPKSRMTMAFAQRFSFAALSATRSTMRCPMQKAALSDGCWTAKLWMQEGMECLSQHVAPEIGLSGCAGHSLARRAVSPDANAVSVRPVRNVDDRSRDRN